MRKVFLILIFLFSVFNLQLTAYSQVSPDTKKVVMIIAEEGFQDDEFLQPKEVLEEKRIAVTVASTTLSEATGMMGAKVKPDILVSDIDLEDFDAVIFVGGMGAVQYLDDPGAHKLARDAVDVRKIVGAICIAPVILTRAGILEGKRATVWSSEAPQLQAGGAHYTGQAVEKDGNIITADGPGSAREFGKEISKALLFP